MSNDTKQVAFLPDWSSGNPYQELLSKAVGEYGWQVRYADYPAGLLPLQSLLSRNPSLSAIHLHWIAPYIEHILWSGSKTRFLAKLFLLAADVALARLRGRRVIWTVHNRISHESGDPARERTVRRLLARVVSRLIFHSEGARKLFSDEICAVDNRRSAIIPHGNYFGCYPDNPHLSEMLAERFSIKAHNKVILFFGAVRRYKGLPRLLAAFRKTEDKDLCLLIAGRASDPQLRKEIEDIAQQDPRIKPYLDFIPEQEVAPLLLISHIVAIPFERTLTSGSVVLAMSQGKALLLPDSARILDIIDDRGTIFFGSDDELAERLKALDPAVLTAMGMKNRQTAKQLDWGPIGQMTVKLYEG